MGFNRHQLAALVAFIAGGCLLSASCNDREKELSRSYRSEAKSNLHSIYVLQQNCFTERATYCGTFEVLNFEPTGANRYAYFLPGDRLPAKKGGPYRLPPGIRPEVNEKGYIVVAVGNIDSDPSLDVWTVDEKNSVRNMINDVNE